MDIIGTGASVLAHLGAAAKAIQQIRDARSKVKDAPDALDKTLTQLSNLEYSLRLVCEVKALQTESVETQVQAISTVAEELRAFLDKLAQEQQKKSLAQLLNALKLGDKDDKKLVGILARLDRARDELSLRIAIAQARLSDQDPCLKDLYSTDPRDDKTRIEETKGGLLYDSYSWVLDHDDFKKWRRNEVPLLWIKADPGKGKTMLLCGIINEVKSDYSEQDATMSYFFCQSTDSRLNSASAVLRGLVYLLASEHPLLLKHIRAAYEGKGKQAFEDANSFILLSKLLMNMLEDSSLQRVCLVVDALDECDNDLPKLLSLILQTSKQSKVKWLVSSRNILDIEKKLRLDERQLRLCLEIGSNISSVSKAVDAYIDHCLSGLDALQDDPELLELVRRTMHNKANDTFLWVSLVAKELSEAQIWDVERVINEVPADLQHLYGRMLKQIDLLKHHNPQNCRLLLSTVLIAIKPLNVEEIGLLAGLPSNASSKPQAVKDMIKLCGSFLVIRNERVFVVHQSAIDFLRGDTFEIFLGQNKVEVHQRLYFRSLEMLTDTLRRDMYGLKNPASSIHEIKTPNPNPLRKIEYACANWMFHLRWPEHVGDAQVITSALERFLSHKYLYWLEALSLTGQISQAVATIQEMKIAFQDIDSSLWRHVFDQYRFLQNCRPVIEKYPLQLYISALLFSPRQSLTRQLFTHEWPSWAAADISVEEGWSPCVQVIERAPMLRCLAYCARRRLLACGADDTVELWDAFGRCIQTLGRHGQYVSALAFSSDGQFLAAGGYSGNVKIWNKAGACLQTLHGHVDLVYSVVFSSDDQLLVSASRDATIKVWTQAGECTETLTAHNGPVKSLSLTSDDHLLASASLDHTVKLWDRKSGEVKTLKGHTKGVVYVSFSPDDKYLASASRDGTIKFWSNDGELLRTLDTTIPDLVSILWLPDCQHVVCTSRTSLQVWNTNGTCLRSFMEVIQSFIPSVWVPDRRLVALTSNLERIEYWDIASQLPNSLRIVPGYVTNLAVSSNGQLLATCHFDSTDRDEFSCPIALWTQDGCHLLTFPTHSSRPIRVRFSPDDSLLVSHDYRGLQTKLWNLSGTCLATFKTPFEELVLSSDSKLCLTIAPKSIGLWDLSGKCLESMTDLPEICHNAAFSSDSILVVFVMYGGKYSIWNRAESCLRTFDTTDGFISEAAFCFDNRRIALATDGPAVQIWDTQGRFLQKVAIEKKLTRLEPDLANPIGHFFLTNRGKLSIEHGKTVWHGYGLDSSGAWVTYNGYKVLWIPPNYRRWHQVAADSLFILNAQDEPSRLRFTGEPPVADW